MTKIVIIVLSLSVFFLELTQSLTMIWLSTQGKQLIILEDQIAEVRRENLLLQQELLTIKSFSNIQAQAEAQGFVPAKYIYLH